LDEIWTKNDQNIEKVQTRATKLLSNKKNLNYEERLKCWNLKLPTLMYRRLRGDVIKMYKIITSKQDSDVTLKFTITPAAITKGNNRNNTK